jgi:hypothetical protein
MSDDGFIAPFIRHEYYGLMPCIQGRLGLYFKSQYSDYVVMNNDVE